MLKGTILFYFPYLSFVFLFLIPLLAGQFFLWKHRKKQLLNYTSPLFLSHLLVSRSNRFYLAKTVGWSLIWIFACLALMGPFKNKALSIPPSFSPPSSVLKYLSHETIFLIDTSASMGVLDSSRGISRLDEAKKIVEDVISQLKGQTVSLYTFTSQLNPLVPSTSDYLFARLMTRFLQINEGEGEGTDFFNSLSSFQNKVFKNPSSKIYTLIFLSDGGDNKWEEADRENRPQIEQKILNSLFLSQPFSFQFFAVGLGDLKPEVIPNVSLKGKAVKSALNPFLLKAMADHLKGVYYQANQWSSWDLAHAIIEKMGKDPLIKGEEEKKYRNDNQLQLLENLTSDLYFQIPLSCALIFYILNLALPDVEKKR